MIKNSHHQVRQLLQERIESGEWALGALIPAEIDLADEYGCARSTINRALQALADAGMLVRKRKGGTRVCDLPVRQAKFAIPIVREQVEELGCIYTHNVIENVLEIPPSSVMTRLNLSSKQSALRLETIHFADEKPFAYEQRWVNVKAVPDVLNVPFNNISMNEWLVKSVPFSNGDVVFYAVNADQKVADSIETEPGTALFVVERTTWSKNDFITTLKLFYKQGYQLYTRL